METLLEASQTLTAAVEIPSSLQVVQSMETLLEATERPTEASSGIQSISLAEPLAKMPASTEVFLPGPTTEPSKEIRSTLLQKELP